MPSGPSKKKPSEEVTRYATGGKVVGRSELDEVGGEIQGFSPDDFYMSATGKNDKEVSKLKHKDGKTMGLPKWLSIQIEELVESDDNPYKYRYDAVRCALVKLVYYQQERRKGKRNEAKYQHFLTMAEIERVKFEADRQHEEILRLKEIVKEAQQRSDSVLITETLKNAEKLVPDMREPYKTRLAAIIQELRGIIVLPGNWQAEEGT